jgi:hypothetical protein
LAKVEAMMASNLDKVNAKLNLQQNTLIKLGDEFGEPGNQYVMGANTWLRGVITDFIDVVRERHIAILKYAAGNINMDPEIVGPADNFYNLLVDVIIQAYPLPVRGQVRGVTSQIRNDLAIVRLDTKEMIAQRIAGGAAKTVSPNDDAEWKKILIKAQSSPAEYKTFCERNWAFADAVNDLVFVPQDGRQSYFAKLALQCARLRIRDDSAEVVRFSDVVSNDYRSQSVGASKVYQTLDTETKFDAFRRYWKSLPHGNLFLALAIKNLLADKKLLKQIIKRSLDLKELLFACLPTVELRHAALNAVLSADHLTLKVVAGIYDFLPEGGKVNWRVNFAVHGINHYLNKPHDDKKFKQGWDNSLQKNRAEVYANILHQYQDALPFVKKVIVHALLENTGGVLQQMVCKVMGYYDVEMAKKLFRDSIKHDAAQMKVDLLELNETVIEKINRQIDSRKKFESGAYGSALQKLQELIPVFNLS